MPHKKAKRFIYKNARPLDFARWKYLFEKGNREEVLTILTSYQNDDGGFGHGLEPDSWNPYSSPIQTWTATRIIEEVNLEDKNHPIIQGVLRYLSSGKDFDGHTWSNTVPTNNDYPHAPWWQHQPTSERSYNPTASLLGFILKYADKSSDFYQQARVLVPEAYAYFKAHLSLAEMHTISCFVELYEYLNASSEVDLVDLNEFYVLLLGEIKQLITYDRSKWGVDYICKPSLFIRNQASAFFSDNKEICQYEVEFILKTQNKDGTWDIPWNWSNYPEEWSLSKNWWKAEVILKNLQFVKAIQP